MKPRARSNSSVARAALWLALGLVSGWSATKSSPGSRPAGTNVELSNHLARLVKKLPAGFTWTWQPPFVVIGDEAPQVVRLRATNTVKWAVDRLKLDYFKRDPSSIIDIWLFKDKASQHYAQARYLCYYLQERNLLVKFHHEFVPVR